MDLDIGNHLGIQGISYSLLDHLGGILGGCCFGVLCARGERFLGTKNPALQDRELTRPVAIWRSAV